MIKNSDSESHKTDCENPHKINASNTLFKTAFARVITLRLKKADIREQLAFNRR